jgi:hypothetical protein
MISQPSRAYMVVNGCSRYKTYMNIISLTGNLRLVLHKIFAQTRYKPPQVSEMSDISVATVRKK